MSITLISSSSDDRKWEMNNPLPPQKNSRGVREIRHIEDGRELLRFFTIMQVTLIISPELPSWLQVNYKMLEGWSRQEVGSKEFLRRILNQAVLSTDKNYTKKKHTQKKPKNCTQLFCIWGKDPGKNEGAVPRGGGLANGGDAEHHNSWIGAGVCSAKPSSLLGLCSASTCCVVSLLQWVRCPGNKHTEHCQLDK